MDPTLMTTEPTREELDITRNWFRIDLDVQQRVGLTPERVAQYAKAYRDGVDLDPIVVFYDEVAQCWWLSEGFHRCAAAMQVGLTRLDARVFRGDKRAAILHAVSANRHGLERSDADKRRAVTTLLEDKEWSLWSDREIASRCGVSPTFVGRVRKSLSTVDSENGDEEADQPTLRQYTTKHGTVATMHVDGIGRNGAARCGDCGRPLSDPASISRGIGPICACKAPAASWSSSAGSAETPRAGEAQTTLTERERALFGPRDEKPVGSVSWCWQTLYLLKRRWERKVFDDQQVMETLAELRTVEAWHVVPPEQPYGSLEGLLTAELGAEAAAVLASATATLQSPADAAEVWQGACALILALLTQGAQEYGMEMLEREVLAPFLAQHGRPQPGTPSAPAEPPAPAPSGRSGTYGQIPAKVLAALQAHGTDGATAHTLATAVAVPYGQVWTSLDRLVKQGKAVKEGTLYRTTKGEA